MHLSVMTDSRPSDWPREDNGLSNRRVFLRARLLDPALATRSAKVAIPLYPCCQLASAPAATQLYNQTVGSRPHNRDLKAPKPRLRTDSTR